MPSVKLSNYGLFLTTAISLLIGITLLILEIVFNYIGFVSSDFNFISCTDTYLIIKYTHLQYQLEVSFVATCLAVATLIALLVLTSLTAKNLYQKNKNNQGNSYQQPLSYQILSKPKYTTKYILASIGTLCNLICFGIYLTFWLQSKHYSSTCLFSYNQTYLLVLVILSGIWLLGFILIHVFFFMTRSHFINLQENQTKSDKYKEMINVTEQPGMNTRKDPYQNYNQHPQYTQQHFDGDTQSFGNKQFITKQNDDNRHNRPNQNQSILNSQNSFAGNNPKKEKQTFQQYRARQMKELIDKKNNLYHQNQESNPNFLHHDQDSNYNPNKYQYQPSPKNKEVLNFYQNDQGDSRSKPYDKNYKEQDQHPRNNLFGKINNNNSKPYSPIRNLGQNNNEIPRSNDSIGSPYNQQNRVRYQNSPQNKHYKHMNQNSYRPQESFRGSQQDTRGQLVFYKRGLQKSRKKQNDNRNQPFKSNNTSNPYNKSNKPTYSSNEVSFKSPSKFESKFAEQQNDYLRRNAHNSILPSNSIKQVTGGSRKVIFDDKYSSSGVPASNYGQSRNLDSSPSQSRSKTKGREGVLTSYIRGKFN